MPALGDLTMSPSSCFLYSSGPGVAVVSLLIDALASLSACPIGLRLIAGRVCVWLAVAALVPSMGPAHSGV